jgi:hypothetical protein
MLTLLSTLLGFASSGLPKVLDFFQDKSDKRHELELARIQNERELAMAERGFVAQQRIEEIKLEEAQVEAYSQERQSLYQHDIEIGKGAAQWVINMRAMVRPTITFGLFALLVVVDIAGIWYAYTTGASFIQMMEVVWDDETQMVWASIISFWFGSQAFNKK